MLALRAEYYRHKLACLDARPDGDGGFARALEHFDLTPDTDVLSRRTVIIPVNITYFPMRARDNFVLRMARRFAKELDTRAVEELSVEGTVLSEDTDIDITLGEPIDVREYLNKPEYASVMACGLNDMQALETDPGSLFNDAARDLMLRYMASIYQLTTINYDHIFATIIRHQPPQAFSERAYRNRIFLWPTSRRSGATAAWRARAHLTRHHFRGPQREACRLHDLVPSGVAHYSGG